MCVIGQVLGSRLYTVYCKGAPEKIIQNCLKETSNVKKLIRNVFNSALHYTFPF